MKRFNKNSRKKFFKLTALTLAMVTAMSVAKPCEVMAASATCSFNYQGRTVNCQLNGSKTSTSAATVHSASGLVLWVAANYTEYQVSNPTNTFGSTGWTVNSKSPTTAVLTRGNSNGYLFKSVRSTHGASETTEYGDDWKNLSINI